MARACVLSTKPNRQPKLLGYPCSVSVHGPKDLENAFRSMLEPRVDALVIQVSAMFFGSEAGLPTWH